MEESNELEILLNMEISSDSIKQAEKFQKEYQITLANGAKPRERMKMTRYNAEYPNGVDI